MLQQVLVQEQVGRATNALGWIAHTPASWFVPVATTYQTQRWILPTVRGEMQECYAITEEGAGSDVDAIVATARRDGDTYVLDGIKWHVTSYNDASYAFVQAKLTDGPHAGEHALFVVDLPSDGVRVLSNPAYSHTISHHHPIVAFEGVRVPASHLVGSEGGGMTFSYDWFRYERMMVAARCLGAAERLIDEATAFATQRRVGGQPLVDFQAIGIMLADSVTELFAARAMTYEAAHGVDTGDDLKLQHTAVLDGQALRIGDGGTRRRPGCPDLRRTRLHPRQRGRALLPRIAGGTDLGGHERGAARDHRRAAGQTRRHRPRLTPPPRRQ